MSQNPNPFLRGYWNLKIVRTLSISHEDGSPHVWRNIHQSQEHLSDEELVSSSCIVTSDFAVVSNGPHPVSAEVLAECDAGEGVSGQGVIGAVVYAIHGDDFDGRPVHVGDTYSAEAAREVVQRLSFETGYFSRAWEISREHITVDTWHYLANLADLATPERDKPLGWEPLRIVEAQVTRLEAEIDQINAPIPPLNSFILPGGSALAAHLHVARTISRRAERLIAELAATPDEKVSAPALAYANRLSDFLFVAARRANNNGANDVLWVPGANR